MGRHLSIDTIFMVAVIFRFTLCDYSSFNEAINLVMKVKWQKFGSSQKTERKRFQIRLSSKRLGNFFAAEERIDYLERHENDQSGMCVRG